MKSPLNPKPPLSLWEIQRRFVCHGCGNCCRGEGFVFLDESDIRRLAVFFGLSESEFLGRYTRLDASGQRVLRDQGDRLRSCVLLKDNRCVAHEAKPLQCRGFPHRWRTADIESYCAGWREMIGLSPLAGQALAPERRPPAPPQPAETAVREPEPEGE